MENIVMQIKYSINRISLKIERELNNTRKHPSAIDIKSKREFSKLTGIIFVSTPIISPINPTRIYIVDNINLLI